jgi:4-hydroxy-2-oxoglutarate aldolase
MGHVHHLTGVDFQIIAGSASFLLPGLAVGAIGGILALANIAPEQCLALRQHVMFGQWSEARELQVRLIPVNNAITRDWGVAALKAAMDMLGLYGGPVRPPLLPIDEDTKEELRSILIEGEVLVDM